MTTHFKLLITACALALLSACGNNYTSTESSSTAASVKAGTTVANAPAVLAQAVDAYRPPESAATPNTPAKPRDLRVAPSATNIDMGAPLASQPAAARQNNQTGTAEDRMGKPMQIGFDRDVAQTATAAATQQMLKWQTTAAGGQVAAINFHSTGAKSMRVGLLVTQLPATATLRFYAKGAATAFEVKGAEVLAVLAKNLAAGDKTDEGRTYWAPDVDGADATIEIEIPAGFAASSVVVSVPSVSHIFMSNKEISTITAQINYTGDTNFALSCQVDVKCSSPVPAATDAVVHLKFKVGTGSFICSGTMLNDNINSSTPYILTANHCISSQTVASTLTTWFKYRSTTCNDGTTGEYYPTTGGADLLYTKYNTDGTLLRLRAAPSVSGVLFAGWDATTTPAETTAVHGVHHPKGDQQRLSGGAIDGYFIRDPDQTKTTSFFGATAANSTILSVNLTTGIVEGGSSGSGLFKGADSNPRLIGQLYGGFGAVCSTATVSAPQATVYGRFDVAFNAGMSDWLNQGIKSVTQFYNAASGVHYYAYGLTDSSTFSTSNPAYSNQGLSFKVSSNQTAGLSPVYRFYNTSNGTYFYTISEKERAAVASNTPRMRNDGVVWYASATAAAGTVPLYSAFNATKGTQYFTTSLTARNDLIAANPQFKTDGIAFYVTP